MFSSNDAASPGTAQVADAIVALSLPTDWFVGRLKPVGGTPKLYGAARPAQHFGSVDVFLEAIERSEPGEVLLADNGGRLDEGCIGDLIALEAKLAGLAGIVIIGAHRDTAQLREIGLPVWSLGACSFGPTRLEDRSSDALDCAQFGAHRVTVGDWIVADEDGVIALPSSQRDRVLQLAGDISKRETSQAAAMLAGSSLRQELQFSRYLEERRNEPGLSLRQHLRRVGGAVES